MNRIVHFIPILLFSISWSPMLVACVNTKAYKQMQSDIGDLQNQLQAYRNEQNQMSALSEKLQRSFLMTQDNLTHIEALLKDFECSQRSIISQVQELKSINQVQELESAKINLLNQQIPLPTQPEIFTDLYNQSITELRRGNIELAATGFQKYLQLAPATPLSDNAAYWLAECFYYQQKFNLATECFQKVINDYPDGNKVPAATLKLAYTYFTVGDYDSSVSTLKKLIEKYPKSVEVVLAGKMVDKITSMLTQ